VLPIHVELSDAETEDYLHGWRQERDRHENVRTGESGGASALTGQETGHENILKNRSRSQGQKTDSYEEAALKWFSTAKPALLFSR
jgi:hypothetical protein